MDDLISRQALVEKLCDNAKEMAKIADSSCGQAVDYYSGIKTGYSNAAIIANSAPTIEPKKGKWIDLRSDGRFGKETRCSKCGEIYWEWMSKFDYCPNCGAKMERSEE